MTFPANHHVLWRAEPTDETDGNCLRLINTSQSRQKSFLVILYNYLQSQLKKDLLRVWLIIFPRQSKPTICLENYFKTANNHNMQSLSPAYIAKIILLDNENYAVYNNDDAWENLQCLSSNFYTTRCYAQTH